MRILFWIIRIALFLLVLTFALKNTGVVTVHYYLGFEWQTPLVLALLAAFAIGAVVGILEGMGYVFRRQREIAALKRELRAKSASQPPAPTSPNV
jgi:uncharacterized integral membrane protein